MEKPKIEDISLDEEDAKLLKLQTDLLLKAKGIKYSILPKLNIVLEEALSRIRKIYDIEVFNEKSIVCSAPSFREKRDSELKINYDYAYVGITGSRTPIWKGFSRIDGKPVKIICYSLNFIFTEYGLRVQFTSTDNLKLTYDSYKKYFDFLQKNLLLFQTIQSLSGMKPTFNYINEDDNAVIPFNVFLEKLVGSKLYVLNFYRNIRFPIGTYELNELINSFVIFYPIYDSLLRIAKGEKDIFEKLTSMIKYKDIFEYTEIKNEHNIEITKEEEKNILAKNIDEKNIVKAGIRWQVFERDNFKCVACGISAVDGAILHIDHIVPRSKGGKDEMNNYQTLCHKCNIGKSNKSQINLRKK
jgi:hypothetical protein